MSLLTTLKNIAQDPIRSKTKINKKFLEQLSKFNYLDWDISSEGEKDIDNKIITLPEF